MCIYINIFNKKKKEKRIVIKESNEVHQCISFLLVSLAQNYGYRYHLLPRKVPHEVERFDGSVQAVSIILHKSQLPSQNPIDKSLP